MVSKIFDLQTWNVGVKLFSDKGTRNLMILQSLLIGAIAGFLWGLFFSWTHSFSKISVVSSKGIFSSILQNSIKRYLILTLFIVILVKNNLILPYWWAAAFVISFVTAVILRTKKNEAWSVQTWNKKAFGIFWNYSLVLGHSYWHHTLHLDCNGCSFFSHHFGWIFNQEKP